MQNTNVPAAQQVKVTVTCTKGTTKKTVTGVKPQCPAGYKMSAATPSKAPAQPAPQQPSAPGEMPAPQVPVGQPNQPNQPNQPLPGAPKFDPNADITITCTKGAGSKEVTGKSPVQCPSGYQMKPMGPMGPMGPSQPGGPG